MLCDVCHKNIATVHLTEIVNEKITEMHICQECAKSKAKDIEQPSLSDFLGGLAGAERKAALKCPSCGFSYEDFRKKGRLGCGGCYAAFKRQLLPLLKKVHSASRHTGKIPLHMEKKELPQAKAEQLRSQLNRAIQLEEYEEAARLRDALKKLEKNV